MSDFFSRCYLIEPVCITKEGFLNKMYKPNRFRSAQLRNFHQHRSNPLSRQGFTIGMNKTDQYDLFIHGDEQDKRVFIKVDEKMTNASTYTILKEDHTLGNLLRMQLHKDKNVLFAGYRVPHPLKHQFDLQLRTNGKVTPNAALKIAINDLRRELDVVRDKLKEEVNRQQNPDNQMFLDM